MKLVNKTITYQMNASDLVTLPEGTSLDIRWRIKTLEVLNGDMLNMVYFNKGDKVLVTLEADK